MQQHQYQGSGTCAGEKRERGHHGMRQKKKSSALVFISRVCLVSCDAFQDLKSGHPFNCVTRVCATPSQAFFDRKSDQSHSFCFFTCSRVAIRLVLLDSRAVDAKRFQGKKTRGRQLKAALRRETPPFYFVILTLFLHPSFPPFFTPLDSIKDNYFSAEIFFGKKINDSLSASREKRRTCVIH